MLAWLPGKATITWSFRLGLGYGANNIWAGLLREADVLGKCACAFIPWKTAYCVHITTRMLPAPRWSASKLSIDIRQYSTFSSQLTWTAKNPKWLGSYKFCQDILITCTDITTVPWVVDDKKDSQLLYRMDRTCKEWAGYWLMVAQEHLVVETWNLVGLKESKGIKHFDFHQQQ